MNSAFFIFIIYKGCNQACCNPALTTVLNHQPTKANRGFQRI